MPNGLKKQPFIGLVLAISGGYVLAHVLIKTGDSLYEWHPGLLADLAVVAGMLSLVAWQRRSILNWHGRHKRATALSALAVVAAFSALAVIRISNERKDAQQLGQPPQKQLQQNSDANPVEYPEFVAASSRTAAGKKRGLQTQDQVNQMMNWTPEGPASPDPRPDAAAVQHAFSPVTPPPAPIH